MNSSTTPNPFFTQDDFSALIEIAPGVRTRTLTRGQLMFSLVEIDDGCSSPIHHHPEVQMGMVLEGTFERHHGGEMRFLHKGEGFYVPPNVEHGGRALGGRCRILDVFSPPAQSIWQRKRRNEHRERDSSSRSNRHGADGARADRRRTARDDHAPRAPLR